MAFTPTPRTRDEAMRYRNRLSNDDEFGKKVAAGDADSLQLIEELTRQMVGEPGAWSSVPPGFGRTRDPKTDQMIEYV
jgi:hypothetical protein